MRKRRGPAVVLAFAALLAAWGAQRIAAAPEGDVAVEATLEKSAVRLGDDVVVNVKLTNRTSRDVRMPELRLAGRSVSFRLESVDGGGTLIARNYGAFALDDGVVVFREDPGRPKTVVSGGSMEARLTFAAVHVGRYRLTPLVWRADGRVEGRPLELEITPRGIRETLVLDVETTRGSFRVDLDGSKAFNTVSQVWSLARAGFYDGLDVHRVVRSVLVQTGCPHGDGTGDPGWYLPAESPTPSLRRGWVGLARGVHPDSGGCQWFVVLADGAAAETAFAAGFTPLGRVAEGMEVVDQLGNAELREGTTSPVRPDRILSVRVGP